QGDRRLYSCAPLFTGTRAPTGPTSAPSEVQRRTPSSWTSVSPGKAPHRSSVVSPSELVSRINSALLSSAARATSTCTERRLVRVRRNLFSGGEGQQRHRDHRSSNDLVHRSPPAGGPMGRGSIRATPLGNPAAGGDSARGHEGVGGGELGGYEGPGAAA